MLNVAERELLYLLIFRLAQIGAEAHTGFGGHDGGAYAHRQRRQRHEHHFKTCGENVSAVAVGNADVHNVTHSLGQQQLKHRLAGRA